MHPAVIRPARPDEADALHGLAAATFALACPPGTTDEDVADFIAAHLGSASFAEYLADPQRLLLVADDGGELLGYTMLVVADPADPDVARAVRARPTAELSKCYVRPEAHGSGLASALVEATVQEAEQRGAASVWLGVNRQNARANGFYAKSGFERVGTKTFRVGAQLHDDFVRERSIRAAD